MEDYIQISTLNDFIFCPKSIYYHAIYSKYNQNIYHEKPQIAGKIKHENIDKKIYSSAKRYLQSLEVYSEKYRLCGKIDVFDKETSSLIERKNKITTIYDGYRYQLYAQYFCLKEMEYDVKKLFLHSLTDNKRYPIDLPDDSETQIFEKLIQDIRSFDVFDKTFSQNTQKCEKCIYRELCDFYQNNPNN